MQTSQPILPSLSGDRNAIARAAHAAAIGLALTTTALPALGQSSSTASDPLGRLVEPGQGGAQTSATTQLPTSRSDEKASSSQATPSTVVDSSPRQTLFSVLGAVCSVAAMGWYYLQLRRRETTASVTTVGLCIANDALLAGAALATGQGWGPAAMLAGFVGVGILCLRETLRASQGPIKFSKLDTWCTAGCLAGWGTLIASMLPQARELVSPEKLAFVGSLAGTTVNTLASIPLVKVLLSKPGRNEPAVTSILKPTMPFVIGTIAMAAGLVSLAEVTLYSVVQPSLLLLNNIALTGCVALWASRRVRRE